MGALEVRRFAGVAACLLGLAVGSAVAAQPGADPIGKAQIEESGMQPDPPQPQVKDQLFAGTEKFAVGASDVTDVNLDPNMLGAIRHKGKDGGMASQLNFIVVHSYEYDKPGMYRMEDVEAYQKKLASGDWNCFIHTRERKSGEATDICRRNGTDPDHHELVIITAEPKELTFVHLSGKMPMGDLQSLGQLGSLGMLMAIPPVPPVPPAPPVPGAPVAPPAPPAPKLQKESGSLNESERQWMELQKVAAVLAPRLEMIVERAQLQALRAEVREEAAVQGEAGPQLRGRMMEEMAELHALDMPRLLAVERQAESEAMRELARHPPQIDEQKLQQQMKQFNEQMKDWQSHMPVIDEQKMQQQMKQFGEQMKNWQLHMPAIDGQVQEHMKQFNEAMKNWQMQAPKIDEQQLQEQMKQFHEQMQQWRSERPEQNKQMQEHMKELQKEFQQLHSRYAGAQHAA